MSVRLNKNIDIAKQLRLIADEVEKSPEYMSCDVFKEWPVETRFDNQSKCYVESAGYWKMEIKIIPCGVPLEASS